MRISGKSSVSGSGASVPSRTSASTSTPGTGPAAQVEDSVSVSGGVQLLGMAQAAAALPEVRTEKVEALRAAIDADRYHPDGEAVADGIVREHTPVRPTHDRRP